MPTFCFFSDRHRCRVSRSLSPQDLPHSAHLCSPASNTPSLSTLWHSCQHLHNRSLVWMTLHSSTEHSRPWSLTPSRPLFSSGTPTTYLSVPNTLRRRCPLIKCLNAAANTLVATPLSWDVTTSAFNIFLSGCRLGTSSPLGHSAWAWIFESKLSSNIPSNSLGHGGNFMLSPPMSSNKYYAQTLISTRELS